jgi:hypothetical protein
MPPTFNLRGPEEVEAISPGKESDKLGILEALIKNARFGLYYSTTIGRRVKSQFK